MIDIAFAGFIHHTINCDQMLFNKSESRSDVQVEQVEKKICNFFSNNYEHVKLTSLKVTSLKATAKAAEKKQAKVVLNEPIIEEPLAGRVKISWWAETKNESAVQLNVTYSMEAYKNIAIFGKNIAINTTIRDSDIYFSTVNVAPFLGIKGFLKESPVGKMVIKKATKGHYVFSDILSPPAMIRKDQVIYVVVKSAGLSINTEAIALENGFAVDSLIKVKVKDTGAVLMARIKSEKIVYVEI
jgi:flagella basal body P-ring formation protein FlgA